MIEKISASLLQSLFFHRRDESESAASGGAQANGLGLAEKGSRHVALPPGMPIKEWIE